MSEHTPLTEEWAVEYARTYWQHGSEPESQAALHVLANALAARTSTATADTGLRERVEAAEAALERLRTLALEWRDSEDRGWISSCGEDLLERLHPFRRRLNATAAPATDTGARDE